MRMEFISFLDKDITAHTDTYHYRGVLVEVLTGVLHFKKGIDDFYIDASKIVAVTVHGREFGKENIDTVKGKIEKDIEPSEVEKENIEKDIEPSEVEKENIEEDIEPSEVVFPNEERTDD